MKGWKFFGFTLLGLAISSTIFSGLLLIPWHPIPVVPLLGLIWWLAGLDVVKGLGITFAAVLIMVAVLPWIRSGKTSFSSFIAFLVLSAGVGFVLIALPYDIYPLKENINYKISIACSIILAIVGIRVIVVGLHKGLLNLSRAALVVILFSPFLMFVIIVPMRLVEFYIPIIIDKMSNGA